MELPFKLWWLVATIQNKIVVGTVPYHDGGIDAKNKCNKQ
jgi:hypothetical protein